MGISYITDYGGSADTLDLSPLSSDEATFEFSGNTLVIYLGNLSSQVQILNYLSSQQFRVERIVFSDTTVTNLGQVQVPSRVLSPPGLDQSARR